MARHHGLKTRGLELTTESRLFEGRFGRMFRGLPVHEHDPQFLRELADSMNETSDDNLSIPAGFTYLGQFVDHDLTFDPASSFERSNDPDALVSFRSPRLDLDSVYGRGPDDDPFMYNQGTRAGVERPDHPDDEPVPAKHEIKFLLGRITNDEGAPLEGFGAGDDLPRNRQGRALIGDPRNDENTFIAQLQLTFLKFHNRLVDKLAEEEGLEGGELFAEAQRLARWHYQWVVIHDFLPRIIGHDRLAHFLKTEGGAEKADLNFYTYKYNPYMPLEFSVAAYRYGHSQIRGRYKINNIVRAPTFTGTPLTTRIQDFRGFRSLPALWTVQWPHFFELDEPGVQIDPVEDRMQLTLKIDTKLSAPLFDLPEPEFDIPGAPHDDERSLARRNLLRGLKAKLPSGGRVARAIGVPVNQRLTAAQLGFAGPAPLWYYVLKEAEVLHDGEHLGPVGATIVAETFLGVLDADPKSYLSQEPTWKPTLTAAGGDPAGFNMADLLRFAVPEQATRTVITFPGQ